MLAFLPILSIVISETDSYVCKVDSSLMWGDISTLDDISGWIEVHVRDNELEPIIGATIEAKNESGTIIATGTTDSIGIATLTDLAPGWYDITINKTGFYQKTAQNHINWPGDDDYLTFYLIPSIANLSYIEVTVKNTTGSFIANARISATRHEDGAPCRIGQTNGSGYYNITELEKRRWYYLSVEASGYLNESYTQYIDYEGAHYNLTFILAEKPAKVATLTVTVFENEPPFNPIPTVNLTIKDGSGAVWGRGFTDGSGEAKISRNQIPGTYWVYASAFGYYQYTNVQFSIADSPFPANINVVMDLAKHAPGTAYMIINVTDIVTSASIPNALITLYNSSFNEKILSGWTNAEGTFNATGLYKGEHTVYVKYGGYTPYPALKQTTIKWNGKNPYVNIKLTPHNQPKMQPISPNTIENNWVPLEWTYSGIVAYYCLYRNTSWFADVSKMTPVHIMAPTTTYIDQITENGTYYYAVIPVYWIDDSPEPGPLSNVVSIFVNYTPNPPSPLLIFIIVISLVGIISVIAIKIKKKT